MTGDAKQRKADFISLMMSSVDSISCNKENARDYLLEEGLDPDSIRAEGIKRIKKLKLQAQANSTRNEMASTAAIKQKAMEWVEKLLNDVNFSFPQFVKTENLVLQNRNLEKLTKEDIKSTLTQYYYLKFMERGNKQSDEQ